MDVVNVTHDALQEVALKSSPLEVEAVVVCRGRTVSLFIYWTLDGGLVSRVSLQFAMFRSKIRVGV